MAISGSQTGLGCMMSIGILRWDWMAFARMMELFMMHDFALLHFHFWVEKLLLCMIFLLCFLLAGRVTGQNKALHRRFGGLGYP